MRKGLVLALCSPRGDFTEVGTEAHIPTGLTFSYLTDVSFGGTRRTHQYYIHDAQIEERLSSHVRCQ